jgi:hypothetical protein
LILQLDVADAPGSIGHPYGVFVREQDDEDFYGFVFSSDMSFAAFHVKDGALAIDGPANAFLPKGLLRTDVPNRVQVFMEDATLVYFLNGREIARANAIWSMGTAGALSATGQPGNTDVVFDDWKVWIASGTGGASGPSSPPRSGANDIDTRSNPAALGGGFLESLPEAGPDGVDNSGVESPMAFIPPRASRSCACGVGGQCRDADGLECDDTVRRSQADRR